MAEPQALPEKAFPVSWDQFHRDARALAWRLAAAGPFTAIVAITRGGLVPAAIVARELNVRLIETVCVESYHDYTKQGELRVLKGVADAIVKLGGKGVLIVDDLVDTGKTAKVVRDLLPGAHFATVYAKPMGRPLVDTFITEVSQDTWIYFPWDTGLGLRAADPRRRGITNFGRATMLTRRVLMAGAGACAVRRPGRGAGRTARSGSSRAFRPAAASTCRRGFWSIR